jgi:hypothetical protein
MINELPHLAGSRSADNPTHAVIYFAVVAASHFLFPSNQRSSICNGCVSIFLSQFEDNGQSIFPPF